MTNMLLKLMRKLDLFILFLLFSSMLSAQSQSVLWRGMGVYREGSAITTVMKKMRAQKNIELTIDKSGAVKGTLVTYYNSALEANGSKRETEEFAIAGRYDPVKSMLLLVLTHGRKDSTTEFFPFSKPDSIFYQVSVHQKGESVSVSGMVDEALNGNAMSEWVGPASGKGMGMDISYNVGMHMLPLQFQLTGSAFLPPKANETNSLRQTNLVQTLLLDTAYLQLALYDNGAIDGDTATLLLDGKTIIDKGVLSAKAISVNTALSEQPEHILELFANNLGSIPPNTALLIITSGRKRYEINLSSNFLVNSGVKLVLKKSH